MKYPKIDTLFKRDQANKIIFGNYTNEVIEALRDIKWECTEKIDGTNIRVYWYYETKTIALKGRNDNAQIPKKLENRLVELFSLEKLENLFPATDVVFYGEGYGAKIQEGEAYTKENEFILFDVRIKDFWLLRHAIEDVASKLEIKAVPLVGYYTILKAIEMVRAGFPSVISEEPLTAEGLILKTPQGLLTRQGERVITKIKHRDFKYFLP